MYNAYYHPTLKSTSVIPILMGFPTIKLMEEKGWKWIGQYSDQEQAERDALEVLECDGDQDTTTDDIPDWVIDAQISQLLGK